MNPGPSPERHDRPPRRHPWKKLILAACGAGLLITPVVTGKQRQEAKPKDEPALDKDAMEEIADYGQGFVVWERNMGDYWRIWSKDLDGTDESQLVPDEKDRDHFCPKISPNGALLAYMSFPSGANGYSYSRDHEGTLWIMDLRTHQRTLIAEKAHSYMEDRAVMWRDNKTICYINENGETMEVTLKSHRKRRVVDYHDPSFGHLPSPDLKHSTSGFPEFAKLGPNGTLEHRSILDGCQPYFTSDGLWGFWMGGSGGPVNAMFLPTRYAHSIVERRDERLPAGRNYVYFPMISSCMRLVAFAASEGEHDHFRANYDIYVAMLNPVTLRMIGKPVRYTMDNRCDRYPDVFRRELPLGTHFVEGETTITFAPPLSGVYDFDFGDDSGSRVHGEKAKHTFSKPGSYRVTATRGKGSERVTLRGHVHVEEPAAPAVVQLQREGGDALLVKFDKAVSLSTAKVSAGDGVALKPELVAEGHAMKVRLPRDLPRESSLTIEGVKTLAEHPAKMAQSVIPLDAVNWPGDRKGIVFAWQDAFNRQDAGAKIEGRVTPSGLAFWNQHGAMDVQRGWFDAPDDGPRIADACQRSNAFTIEAVVTPQPAGDRDSDAVIMELGDARSGTNLKLKQRDKLVSLELKCGGASDGRVTDVANIYNLDASETHHLAITFAFGELNVFDNGQPRGRPIKDLGGIMSWKRAALRFGSASAGDAPWRGILERIAVYDRALSSDEVRDHARGWDATAQSRAFCPEWNAVVKLVESTPVPSLQEIQPYKNALVRRLYEVRKRLNGDGLLAGQIVVTQWAWLDGQPTPAQGLKPGDIVRLTLHAAEAHPELKPLVIKDSLTQGLDAPVMHDTSDWDRPLPRK